MSDRPNSTVNSVHWTELQFTDMNMKVKVRDGHEGSRYVLQKKQSRK